MRHLRPRETIEVGSGFSSLAAARVNREHLNGGMQFMCIEPYPRGGSLLAGVPGITDLLVRKVEDVPLSRFAAFPGFVDHVPDGGGSLWLRRV